MEYKEYESKNRIVDNELLNKILDYNNILDLDLLNKSNYPYDYEHIDEFIRLVDKHKKISIIGDYDCDGICATAIMYIFLNRLGKDVNYVIGNRVIDGYGMNTNLINSCISNNSTLIITVDNGINSVEEVEYAKSKGVEVIITDHHLSTSSFPNCLCFNPHYDENIKFKEVCGAFVAFSLVHSYFRHKNSIDRDFLNNLYELAALATISDVMPLYDINRLLVNNLVKNINYKKIKNKGIKMLCNYFNFGTKNNITALDISFSIVPVINASGRLDDASFVVNLFTGNESKEIVDEIIRINEKRKSLTNEAFEMIRLDPSEKIYVCYIENISEGLLGILSGKILNMTKKPTFVFTNTNDLIKGSGRSLENFDLHESVNNMDIDFNSFGGHKRAIGLSFSSMDEFLKFKKDVQKLYVPNPVTYFIKYSYSSFNETFKIINKLEPLGEGIKIPYFYVEAPVTDVKIYNNKHTSFRCLINNKFEKFIYYNNIIESGRYKVLFELKNSQFGIQGQVYKMEKVETEF